jgi:hypothetical protein
MADVNISVDLNSSSANRGLKELKTGLAGLGKGADSVSGSFLKLAAAAGGIVGAVRGLQSIAQTGASFEDLRSSLNAVFGSIEEGSAAFDRVKKFAKTTQFSVQQLTKNFVQLKAAGVEPTEKLLRTFADAASVTTDELGAFQSMIDLVARTTAGGLGLEELNRLADRGIPVFAILEEKLGLTRLEISEVGKTAEGARQIIAALTEGLEEQFGGASLARAQNLNQILNNLGDATDDLRDSLFQAGFGRFFKVLAIGFGSFVEEITKLVSDDSLNDFFDGLADSIFKVISNALLAGAAIYDALAPVFSIALTGLKNLIGFLDGLPAELKAIGIIGFLFLGTKGKLIILAITQSVDIVLGLINKIIGAFEWMVNKGVDAINTLIEAYNKIPGLDDIDLAEKVTFGRIDIDEAKEKLGELSDKLFDAIGLTSTFTEQGMTGAVGNALDNARAAVEKFLAEYGTQLNKLDPKKDGDGDGTEGSNTFSAGWARAFEEFQTNAQDAAAYGENIFNTFTDGITDAIMSFVETGKLSFKDLFKSLLAEIIKFQTMRVVSGFFSMFGGGGAGGGLFGSLFSGGKATGGYIPSGRFAITGEGGPELVRGPATVSSHEDSLSMLGGGGGQAVTYNINAVDAYSFKQLVAQDPEFIYNVTRVGQRRMPA